MPAAGNAPAPDMDGAVGHVQAALPFNYKEHFPVSLNKGAEKGGKGEKGKYRQLRCVLCGTRCSNTCSCGFHCCLSCFSQHVYDQVLLSRQ